MLVGQARGPVQGVHLLRRVEAIGKSPEQRPQHSGPEQLVQPDLPVVEPPVERHATAGESLPVVPRRHGQIPGPSETESGHPGVGDAPDHVHDGSRDRPVEPGDVLVVDAPVDPRVVGYARKQAEHGRAKPSAALPLVGGHEFEAAAVGPCQVAGRPAVGQPEAERMVRPVGGVAIDHVARDRHVPLAGHHDGRERDRHAVPRDREGHQPISDSSRCS